MLHKNHKNYVNFNIRDRKTFLISDLYRLCVYTDMRMHTCKTGESKVKEKDVFYCCWSFPAVMSHPSQMALAFLSFYLLASILSFSLLHVFYCFSSFFPVWLVSLCAALGIRGYQALRHLPETWQYTVFERDHRPPELLPIRAEDQGHNVALLTSVKAPRPKTTVSKQRSKVIQVQ